MSFNSPENYNLLKEIVNELFPIETMESLKHMFDQLFNDHKFSTDETLCNENKKFLQMAINVLEKVPKKLTIREDFDFPAPKIINFQDIVPDEKKTTDDEMQRFIEQTIAERNFIVEAPKKTVKFQQDFGSMEFQKLIQMRDILNDLIDNYKH